MRSVSIIGLFCEDIREEKSGSETIIGIFTDNIEVPTMPGGFRSLCIYVRVSFDPETDLGDINLNLVNTNGEAIELGALDPVVISQSRDKAISDGAPLAGLVGRVKLANFNIPTPGRVLVTAKIGGDETVIAFLNIKVTAPKNSDK